MLQHINNLVGLLPPILWMSPLLGFMEAVAKVCSARWLQECLTVVAMGSFNVVFVVGAVSKVYLVHDLPDFVCVEPASSGAPTWVNRVVRQLRLDSYYILTTFICWNDVACESRKLLSCGKLSLILACFSTNFRFLVGKEAKNALVVVLMWKLLDLSLDMNSSYHTPTKILIREFMNMVRCLLGANLTRGNARWWQIEVVNTYNYVSNHNFIFRQFQVIYGPVPCVLLDLSTFRYKPHSHGEVVNFVTELQGLHQRTPMVLVFSARKYKASNFRRRHMVFDPGDIICPLFAKDRLPPHEYQQASTCSPIIEINNFIFPLETFGIRYGDTWILSLEDKRSK